MVSFNKYIGCIAALILVLFSCMENEINSSDLPPNTLEVSNIVGTIELYRNEYSISLSIPNTIDSRVIGIVDDLNEDFRSNGQRVKFSGIYAKSDDNPNPILGGDDVYSLNLTDIKNE